MKSNKDIYEFERCKICNRYTQLKNKLCITCNNKDIPDFIKDLFKKRNNDESTEN